MKLHHVGIAVADLTQAVERYRRMGLRLAHRETLADQGVEVAFMGRGPYVELLQGIGSSSTVSRFVRSRGPGQHHVAFSVRSIAAELRRQASAGARLIDRKARAGAWGHKVAFLHPADQGGVLIELVEVSE